MRGGTLALFFCLRSAAFRATKYKLMKVSTGSATAAHPTSMGLSRIMNSPRKQNATCVQNTGREACPMITSGRNASFLSDSWKRINNAATQANSIGRTIPKCHLSKAGSNRPRVHAIVQRIAQANQGCNNNCRRNCEFSAPIRRPGNHPVPRARHTRALQPKPTARPKYQMLPFHAGGYEVPHSSKSYKKPRATPTAPSARSTRFPPECISNQNVARCLAQSAKPHENYIHRQNIEEWRTIAE